MVTDRTHNSQKWKGLGLALPISLEWCRFGTGGRGSEEQTNCLPHALADAFKWLSGEHGPDDGGIAA